MTQTTIRTTLPLDLDAMRQVITTPDVVVEIDYANSKLKGRAALIYMTNTSLQKVKLDMTGAAKEDIFALMNDYITHKSVIMLPQLVNTVMGMLLQRKGVVLPELEQKWMDSFSVVSLADTAEFCQNEQYAKSLDNLIALLDNLPLFAISRSKAFQSLYGDAAPFSSVNNVDFTGFTFINLFQHVLFLEYYTAPIKTQPTYFTQQFDEYMYNGKSLFAFFSKAPVMAMLDVFINGKVTAEQLAKACEEAKTLGA